MYIKEIAQKLHKEIREIKKERAKNKKLLKDTQGKEKTKRKER